MSKVVVLIVALGIGLAASLDGQTAQRTAATGTGVISGTVINEGTRTPVATATVILRRLGARPDEPTITARTDDSGRYRVEGLAAGAYTVEISPSRNSTELIHVLFEGHPCPYTGCTLSQATPVQVVDRRETTVDVSVPVGGSINGMVTDAVTLEPLAHVLIIARSPSFQARAVSGAGGLYRINALPSGTYEVEARPAWEGLLGAPQELGLRLEQMLSQTHTGPVTVRAPNGVPAINFPLGYGGRIQGTVTAARTGAPVAGVSVQVNGGHAAQATTDSQGRYEVGGMPTGTYTVFVRLVQMPSGVRTHPFVEQVYQGVPCASRSCWDTKGTPVRVTAPRVTANIDFVLEPATSPARSGAFTRLR